eukprot:3324503-Rhodomonas_salina.4
MSGTHLPYAVRTDLRCTSQRACYVMDDTDLPYGAPVAHVRQARQVLFPICLRACYAMSGTDLLCGATRPRFSKAITGASSTLSQVVKCSLRDARYWGSFVLRDVRYGGSDVRY